MFTSVNLTVLFEEPFWIGIFEIQEDKYYKICKVTFGSEPKDAEVLKFILSKYYRLKFFEEKGKEIKKVKRKENPKKVQRKIKKEVKEKGIGTKAQIVLKSQYEASKVEHKKKSREEKEEEEIRKFQIKQNKKKEKHKGH